MEGRPGLSFRPTRRQRWARVLNAVRRLWTPLPRRALPRRTAPRRYRTPCLQRTIHRACITLCRQRTPLLRRALPRRTTPYRHRTPCLRRTIHRARITPYRQRTPLLRRTLPRRTPYQAPRRRRTPCLRRTIRRARITPCRQRTPRLRRALPRRTTPCRHCTPCLRRTIRRALLLAAWRQRTPCLRRTIRRAIHSAPQRAPHRKKKHDRKQPKCNSHKPSPHNFAQPGWNCPISPYEDFFCIHNAAAQKKRPLCNNPIIQHSLGACPPPPGLSAFCRFQKKPRPPCLPWLKPYNLLYLLSFGGGFPLAAGYFP